MVVQLLAGVMSTETCHFLNDLVERGKYELHYI